MKEFMLLFRQPSYDYSDVSKEEMAALSKKRKVWWQGIDEKGKLADRGPLLAMEGKVLKPGGVVTDGLALCGGETKSPVSFSPKKNLRSKSFPETEVTAAREP